MTPRSTVSFDPGIGGADPADPRLQAALAGLEQSQRESYRKPAAAQPAAAAVPQPPAPAPVDEYRERNPSLPRIKFATVEHLPSAGKAYPAGVVIRYRPYTLGESIYVEESKLDMRETYALICKGLECKGIEPNQLTLPDVLYLGLVRKIAVLGDAKVNVTSSCPHCGGLNRTPIEASRLEFDDLQVPALPIRAPFSFGEHSFAPLTLERYLDLLDRDLETKFVALMAAQCTSVPDLDTAMQMIEDMTDADDIAMLKEIDELLHHELRPLTITCPQELEQGEGDEPGPTCGQRYPVALDDVSAAFVLPFSGRDQGSVRRQIAFG